MSEAGSDADDLNFELLSHISPIGWDNVLLYGEYQLNPTPHDSGRYPRLGLRGLQRSVPTSEDVTDDSNARLTASGSFSITCRRVAAGPLTRRVPCSHFR